MSGGTSNSTLSLLFNAKDLEDLLAKTELTKKRQCIRQVYNGKDTGRREYH